MFDALLIIALAVAVGALFCASWLNNKKPSSETSASKVSSDPDLLR